MPALAVPSPWPWLEQTAGGVVTAAVLLDIFLTVLYARMGYSIVADLLADIVWRAFFTFSKLFSDRRPLILSFGGPVIIVLVVAFWVAALVCGQALVFHPALGSAITASHGPTPRDFIAAVFAAGGAIVMPGGSSMQPNTSGFRILFLLDAVTGLSILTLTLTYIVEIYNALHARNTLGLKLYLMSGKTGDAADLIAALAPDGDFRSSYSVIMETAAEITSLKESHNFYPVLFYFRFRAAYYSVSMSALMALDTAALLSTALEKKRHGWLARSAAVNMLRESAILLVSTLQQTFLPKSSPESRKPDERRLECWRRRYLDAVARLKKSGVETRMDEAAGAQDYVEMRKAWDPGILTLAPALGFDMADVDPALSGACAKSPPS